MDPISYQSDSYMPTKRVRFNNSHTKLNAQFMAGGSDRFIRPLDHDQMIYASSQLEDGLEHKPKITLDRRIVPITPAASRIKHDEYISKLQIHIPHFNANKIFSLKIDKVLDAPNFGNNYYYHLLQINNSGLTIIALNNCIYGVKSSYKPINILIADPTESAISCLMPLESKHSISNKLIYSNAAGMITVMDLTTYQAMWNRGVDCDQHVDKTVLRAVDDNCFYVATYNGSIIEYDVRSPTVINQYRADADRACSLVFNHQNSLVSGNNNNKIFMYDVRRLNSGPVFSYDEHNAGVRAIDFSPNGEFVVSGGGTACKTLAVWQTSTGKTYTKFKTSMQITSVKWLPDQQNSIYTSNGFQANYGITGWKYKGLQKSRRLEKNYETFKIKNADTRFYDIAYDAQNDRFSSVSSREALYFFKLPEKKSRVRKFSTRDELSISEIHSMNQRLIR